MTLKYISTLLFTTTLMVAYDNSSLIDATHNDISRKVIATSDYIDDTLYNWFGDDNKTSSIKQNANSIDSFYKNNKFIDETDESFLRIRVQSNYQRLEKENYDFKLRAYLALSKTRQNIKFFIENVNQDNFKKLPFKNSNSNDSAIAIGISYFTLAYNDIDSKYSLGIRGLNPYLKIRYKKTFIYDDWLIEPSQSFTYSTKTNFKEETILYFNNKFDKSHLFRIALSRSTESERVGMDYSLALQYFYLPKKNTGISFVQSFSGNSKYNFFDDSNNLHQYKSINTYNTEISWRQNIWKKWFFYEVKPGMDFQKINNFKINYKILFLTDFYFGYGS